MATISRTKSGTWRALIRRQGWPQTIKTFRLKRDAQDWARTTEDEMMRGIHIPQTHGERMTLNRALERYLNSVTLTKRPASQISDRKAARRMIPLLGDYKLAALSPDVVANYRDTRLNTVSERTGRVLSNTTVRLELALLGHLFTVARREWGLGLVINPVHLITSPPPSPGRTRRLVGDEEARLLAACDGNSNPMLGWIVRLALFTAMRRGEISSLTQDQVDLSRRVIRLTETKNGDSRTVPLSTGAVAVLRMALDCPLRRDSNLIFPGEPGRNGKRRAYIFNRIWTTTLKRAGIDGLRFHDLRHEAVSRLVERGFSDQEVVSISGHKTMAMLRRYTHLRTEDLVDRLG